MSLTKLLTVFALSLSLVACVDEIDDTTTEEQDPADVDQTADGTDGVPGDPVFPDDDTCATQRKADGACVPSK